MPPESSEAQRALIAPLSESAWSITRLIQHLSTEGRPPDALILLSTQGARSKKSRVLLEFGLSKFCPWLRIVDLKLEPLTRPEVITLWLERVIGAVSMLRSRTVSLLITGSPPVVESALTLLSPFLPLDGVYHVILKGQEGAPHGWNWLIERAPTSPVRRLPPDVERVLTAVFWPRETDYTIVQMPVLPYPVEVARAVADLLCETADKVEYRKRGLKEGYVVSLIIAGLVEVSRTGDVVPTSLGRVVGRIVSKLLLAEGRAVRR